MFFEFPLRRTETLKILVMHFHGKSMVNPGSPSQNHPWTNHWKYHKILSLAGAPYVDPVDQSYPILSHIIPYYPILSPIFTVLDPHTQAKSWSFPLSFRHFLQRLGIAVGHTQIRARHLVAASPAAGCCGNTWTATFPEGSQTQRTLATKSPMRLCIYIYNATTNP